MDNSIVAHAESETLYDQPEKSKTKMRITGPFNGSAPLAALSPKGEGGKTWYVVEVNGFDYFDTAKGELVSGGKAKIAMWLLDTDYDDRSLFSRQVFFPMAGKGDGWHKLKRDIRAELDESQLDKFHGTVSLPFEAGDNGKDRSQDRG